MTTVTNTVQNEVGAPIPGIPVQIRLLASNGALMTTAFVSGIEIDPDENTVTDADGKWTLNLAPNVSIAPAGTKYQVTHVLPSDIAATTDVIVLGDGGQVIANANDLIVNFVVPVDGATPVTHRLADLVVP